MSALFQKLDLYNTTSMRLCYLKKYRSTNCFVWRKISTEYTTDITNHRALRMVRLQD